MRCQAYVIMFKQEALSKVLRRIFRVLSIRWLKPFRLSTYTFIWRTSFN